MLEKISPLEHLRRFIFDLSFKIWAKKWVFKVVIKTIQVFPKGLPKNFSGKDYGLKMFRRRYPASAIQWLGIGNDAILRKEKVDGKGFVTIRPDVAWRQYIIEFDTVVRWIIILHQNKALEYDIERNVWNPLEFLDWRALRLPKV